MRSLFPTKNLSHSILHTIYHILLADLMLANFYFHVYITHAVTGSFYLAVEFY